MAKKYNRGRQQKRNVDRRKLEKYREEVARELGVELPEKEKDGSPGEYPYLQDRRRSVAVLSSRFYLKASLRQSRCQRLAFLAAYRLLLTLSAIARPIAAVPALPPRS